MAILSEHNKSKLCKLLRSFIHLDIESIYNINKPFYYISCTSSIKNTIAKKSKDTLSLLTKHKLFPSNLTILIDEPSIIIKNNLYSCTCDIEYSLNFTSIDFPSYIKLKYYIVAKKTLSKFLIIDYKSEYSLDKPGSDSLSLDILSSTNYDTLPKDAKSDGIIKCYKSSLLTSHNKLNTKDYLRLPQNENRIVDKDKLHPLNRESMSIYMRNNWNKRPTRFGNFNGIGGDCTNFASQVIYSGGAPMDTSGKLRWYYFSYTSRSPSWTGVNELYTYLTRNDYTGPIGENSSLELLETGDLVMLAKDNVKFHSLIIVNPYGEYNDGDKIDQDRLNSITVSAHSFDVYNYPLAMYDHDRVYIKLLGYIK